jgi:pimeloyl-ACP methyl ester carboxylesterase
MSNSMDTNRKPTNKQIDISISGGSEKLMAYRHWSGSSDVPVIMLHGWLDNSESFSMLMESAPMQCSNMEFAAIDFAGHGESFTRPAGENLHFIDNVADILAFTQAMGWEKFHIIGHSMGAALGSLVTATYPEKVLGFVSIEAMGPMSTDAKDAVKQLRQHLDYRLKVPGKTPRYQSVDEALEARMKKGGANKPAMRAMVLRNLSQQNGEYQWKTDQRLRYPTAIRMTPQHTYQVLKSIAGKMLTIWGDQGFKKLYPEMSSRGDEFAEIKQQVLVGGHHLHMENPEPVAAAIMEYLESYGAE